MYVTPSIEALHSTRSLKRRTADFALTNGMNTDGTLPEEGDEESETEEVSCT
jgi:hypothetical protein